MSDQMAGFHNRINRIKDPRNTYYVDGETGAFVPKRVSRKQIKDVARRRNEKATFNGTMMAIVWGALALMASRWVRWNQLGIEETGTLADTLLMVDAGMAIVAVFIFGGMIGQKTLVHMMAQTAGVAVMVVAMHNLVWIAPEQFAQVYGAEYVAQVQSATLPMSINLRGDIIPIPL